MFDADAAANGESGVVPPGPLAVRDVRPEGPSDGRGIRLRLDRAVVDPAAPKSDASIVLERIDAAGTRHPVPASSAWTRADTLELRPEDELPEATAFEARLVGRIVDSAGGVVEGTTWRFETERPTLAHHETWEQVHGKKPIWIVPSSPIDPLRLAAHLRVRAGTEDVRVDVRRATKSEIDDGMVEAALAIVPRRAWPAGAVLDVGVDASLTGDAGPLAMGTAWRIRLDVRPHLSIGDLRCPGLSDGVCPLGAVAIATSTTIDSRSFDRIRVEPKLDDMTVTYAYNTHAPGITIDGEWQSGTHYRVVFDRRIVDEHGTKLGRTKRVAVRVSGTLGPEEATIGLSNGAGIFTSPKAAKIAVSTRHVTAVDVRVATVHATEVPTLVNTHDLARIEWPATDRDVRSQHVLPARSRWNERIVIDVGKDAALGDVVLVEATAREIAPHATAPETKVVRGVYRISALGVVAHRGPRQGFVRVTSVEDGTPIADADVELFVGAKAKSRRATDRDGLVRIEGAGDEVVPPSVLVRHGDDAIAMRLARQPVAHDDDRRHGRITAKGVLAVQPRGYAEGKRPRPLRAGEMPSLEIHTGRSVYQAEDAVNVAGWASISTPHAATATRRVPTGTKVLLGLQRDMSNVATKTVRIDEHGRFHGELRVPNAARLGSWSVTATLLGTTTSTSIVVAEMRIPTFEVDLDVGPGEILRGTEIAAKASARYLSGEAATIGVAHSRLSCHPSPPALHELDVEFSAATDATIKPVYAGSDGETKDATAKWRFPTADLDPRTGWSCALSVAIADQSLQEVGADDSVHIHAANVHLALRELRPTAGKRRTIEAIAVDHHGRRVALAGVEIRLDRDGSNVGRQAKCRVDIAADGPPAKCRTAVLRAGKHRIVAHAMEGEHLVHIEREMRVEKPPVRTTIEASVPIVAMPAPPRVRTFEIDVADDLVAGRRAEVDITAPWDTGKGVLAVEQIGLRETIPFEIVGGHAKVHVTPSADLGPAIELVARVARGAEAGDLAREHVTQASVGVSRDRQLRVQITARGKATIGERVPIRVDVHDQGLPVDARVALWVVDVGLDELRSSHPPSMSSLDRDRRHERSVARTYDSLLDPYPSLFGGRSSRKPSVRMAHADVKGGLDNPAVRRRFDSAPLFVGNVGTGKDGHVTVDLDLPDDLTRFRITAVASASLSGHPESGPARFGDDQAFITTSTPLAVRAAMPRSLRPGDETTVAALVTVPRTGDVDVSLELLDDAIRSIGAVHKRIRGVRGSIARVTFKVKAHATGEPRVRLRATLHEDGSKRERTGAVEQQVAIRQERTQSERVALYGSVDDDRVHAMPVRLPRKALPSSGTIEVTTTTNLLGDFSDAEAYLVDYPHGCIEQSASRLVPLVGAGALGDRSAVPEKVRESATKMIGYILSMQLDDGSFAYWPGARTSAGFAGGYALWILQLAERRGFDVPADALARARSALTKHVRGTDPTDATTAPEYPQDPEQWLTHVMLLQSLADADESKTTDFDLAYANRDKLSISARALLTMAMHRTDPKDSRVATLRRGLDALVEERASVAHFVAPDGSARGWWDSPARDDAIGLMTMLQVDPASPIVDKLAAGLVARRVSGRWRTTQENAFALLALAEYASKRETDTPDHRVRAWIGDRAVLDVEVKQRDDVRRSGTAPLDAVRDAKGIAAVTLARKGTGRVHWRVGVQWTEADPRARAQGLRLTTRILDEHDKAVTRMQVGRRYRIEVVLASDTPQQHIAVDLPLPAGVDAIDRSLGHGVAARAASTIDSSRLSHIELRSERATLYFDALDPGRTIQQIAVLATAAGTYALPGAVAEAMYEPETFARTRAARIEIDPRTP